MIFLVDMVVGFVLVASIAGPAFMAYEIFQSIREEDEDER